MPNYLLAIQRPTDYDPSLEDDQMRSDIDELNRKMLASGIRVFVGGLRPQDEARSIRLDTDGQLKICDEAYLDSAEHVSGFWVIDAFNMKEALSWGRKAALACRASIEVRAFH